MTSITRFQGTTTYLSDPALEAAVNCAVALERPLLIKGEPGTGKTLLAEAIATAMKLPLISWSVKSTTRAQDGSIFTIRSSASTTPASERVMPRTSSATSGSVPWGRPSRPRAGSCF